MCLASNPGIARDPDPESQTLPLDQLATLPHWKHICRRIMLGWWPENIFHYTVRGLLKMFCIFQQFANDYSVTFNLSKTFFKRLGRCQNVPNECPQIYLKGMDLKLMNKEIHLGNIVTSQLTDNMDIQLKRGQFYGAVNNLCAKLRNPSGYQCCK